MPGLANRIQVVNANQEEWHTGDSRCTIHRLITVAKGTREFIKLRFAYPDGSIEFYVNEMINGQPEAIENDEEFEEITIFMDLALERNKHGRGF